jgi:simple sugar transport system ATP-binding protein
VLRLEHIVKTFGATRAVDDVSLAIESGEIVGLVGENGAGKTTLMRIAAAELRADGGTIAAPEEIGIVHQHFLLVNELTIAENLALVRDVSPKQTNGEHSPLQRWGFLTSFGMTRAAEETIAATGIALSDVRRRVSDLSVGEKSKLELIKAIANKPRVLILDEPTSVLAPAEAEELFAVVQRLAASGTAVIFISHKLPEVLRVAQRVVVMRRGRIVAEGRDMSAQQLAEAMIGITPSVREGPGCVGGAEVLTIRNLVLKKYEIVAIIGVAGNGQTELAKELRDRAVKHTIAHIPEDRTRDGLIGPMSIAENFALVHGLRDANARATRLIALYSIRAESPKQRADSLSGGNQQKVILARELDRQPQIVVAAEPTRGLDIDATRFVHEQLRDAAANGAAILLITSDLDEAFALADAIHVIYRGKLSARLTTDEARLQAPALMTGVA